MKKILLNTTLFKIISYISSLALASYCFYLKTKELNEIIATVQFVIVMFASLYVIWYFNMIANPKVSNIEEVQILSSTQEKFDTSNYLFSNILPIATLDFDDLYGIVLFFIIIFVLGVIYYKNDLFYINPLYDILGKYTYTAQIIIGKSTKQKEAIVISNHKIYNFDNMRFCAVVKNNIVILTKEIL